jgi:hypothetical protein
MLPASLRRRNSLYEIAFSLPGIRATTCLLPFKLIVQVGESGLSKIKESMGNQAILFFGESSKGVKK